MTQFVSVKFNPQDSRTYAYSHDGEAVAAGDLVEVDTPRDGLKTVLVTSVTDTAPAFKCKPVMSVIKRAHDGAVIQ
jgi:hypothetical protein